MSATRHGLQIAVASRRNRPRTRICANDCLATTETSACFRPATTFRNRSQNPAGPVWLSRARGLTGIPPPNL
jgi:hypothetical protein